MKNLHIKNSYNTWSRAQMLDLMTAECVRAYNTDDIEATLNRSLRGCYIEWWLHNIGYWITKPFWTYSSTILNINLRCKSVDLEEHSGR